MNQIKTAFLWKKPAIINTHRLNFIGAINEENRNQNLKDFKELLTRIINKWPDVEFLSSNQLVEVIKSK